MRSRSGILLLGILPPLLFALYTGQVWEDFYIAYRHSVSLCDGHGLSYQPGERIQGFSSPLAVLIAAGAHALARPSHDLAIALLRGVGILAYALGLLWLLRGLGVPGRSWRSPPVLVAAALYLLESKAVAFSANGMETGLVLCFLAGAMEALGGSRWKLGAFWALLLWTRPDGCVFVAGMALGMLLFPEGPWRPALGRLLQSAGLCAALYLPWLVFACLYYGSPIPLTVLAKQPVGPWVPVGIPSVWARLFLPAYSEFGRWDPFVPLAGLLAALGCLAFLVPGLSRSGRRSSLCAAVGAVYLAVLPKTYPWYFPPVMLLTLPALAALLERVRPRLLAAGLLLVAAMLGWRSVDYARLARTSAEVTEQGHRRGIGLWLRQHAAPGDRVFLECPGIIGFYAGLHMLDWPGLVTPEVVRLRRLLGDDMAWVAGVLRPEWLVLRPGEVALFERSAPGWLAQSYMPSRRFDVRQQLMDRAPGHPEALYDAVFQVYRRR